VFVRLPGGDQVQALVQNIGDGREYAMGDPVSVYLPAEALRVLTDTGTAPAEDLIKDGAGPQAGAVVST
jgi:hypothetical protein